ncbi:MAG TPA: hypothetical protein VFJ12_07015 [Segeticoccus sp.]|nr:hypothetical protein [Segeticoccus sp.]
MSEAPGDDHRDERGPGDAHGPDHSEDVDRRFAEIVAHWDDPAPEGDRRPAGGSSEPAPGAERRRPPAINPPPWSARPRPPERSAAERPAEPDREPREPDPGQHEPAEPERPAPEPAWRGYEVAEEEEHFVPAPPRPLPAGDLSFWGIVAGLLGGPALLLYLAFFDGEAGGLWVAVGLGLTIGGFGLLVARQPHRRDEDDDDNGAQV